MAGRLLRYWKNLASGMGLQKFVLVNLTCLDNNDLKSTVFAMLWCIYEPKNTNNNLTSSPQITDKVFFWIVEHLSLVVERCFIVDSYFKLSNFLPCALNYNNLCQNWPIRRNWMSGRSYIWGISMLVSAIL